MNSILFRRLTAIVGGLAILFLVALVTIALVHDYLQEKERKRKMSEPAREGRAAKREEEKKRVEAELTTITENGTAPKVNEDSSNNS